MSIFSNINIITIIIICIFFMPLLTGLLYPISSNRIQHSFMSLLSSFKFILGILLAINLSNLIFSDEENSFVIFINQFIPIRDFIFHYNHDIVAYIIVLFIILSIVLFVLELFLIPLHRYVIVPFIDSISPRINSMNPNTKRLFSGIWRIPKAICIVLIFSLMLSFYTNYINNPSTVAYINRSLAYQMIHKNVLHPILSTNIAKEIPILINDSFKKAAEDFTPANNHINENPNYWKVPVIKYFNGMTLDEAIKSDSKIDNIAVKIIGNEKNDKEKAYLLYQWISRNIQYDKGKAEVIVKDPSLVNSGSIVTYKEHKGICFDYACLYISMCRAVGLKVRFVTGLGFNGFDWGDHAWNQVYDRTEKRWINVDTTFGSSGYDNFDNANFSTNHKYDIVQGEW